MLYYFFLHVWRVKNQFSQEWDNKSNKEKDHSYGWKLITISLDYADVPTISAKTLKLTKQQEQQYREESTIS